MGRARRRNIILALVVSASVVAVLVAAFLTWALTPYGPDDEALAVLDSTEYVKVEHAEDGWWEFTPIDDEPHVGLVLYPGGRVDARSYAPLAAEIAEHGYFVAVAPMRLNLAILSADEADKIIEAHPEIMIWTIGGHSLGGTAAARYARQNPTQVEGVALLASYPAGSDDLSETDMAVTSVFGSMDGVLDSEQMMSAVDLLPSDTSFVKIEGGNHAQFGSYGEQSGDNPAAIDAEDQRWQAVSAVVEMLLPLRIRTGS